MNPEDTGRYERLNLSRDPNWKPLPPPYMGRPVNDPDLPIRDRFCPCCGHRTIAAGFDICAVCGWAYSPDQERPYKGFGTNVMSLFEAQQSYLEIGAVNDDMVAFVRAPRADEPRDPDWQPLPSSDEGPGKSDLQTPQSAPPGVPRDAARHDNRSDLTCPVCGYKAMMFSFLSPWSSTVCEICGWFYYLGHLDLQDWSRPNPVTLREVQANFSRLGAWCEDPVLRHGRRTRAPTSEDVRDPKWEPLD